MIKRPNKPILTRRSVMGGLMSLPALPALSTASAFAQGAYPERPIRMICPFGPGTGTDAFARQVTGNIQSFLGQPIVVENRAGANAITGTEAAVRSAPDGYTLLFSNDAMTCLGPNLFKLPYDVKKDIAPVAGLAQFEYTLAVSPAVGVKTVQELVALAKAKPGTLSVGATGVGTGSYFIGEAFGKDADIKITGVQYQQGAAQLFADTLTGRVSMVFYPYQFLKTYFEAGQLIPLAVTSPERREYAKDKPTMKELGYARTQSQGWFCVYAPTGTPADRIAKLSDAFRKVVDDPEFKKVAAGNGVTLNYQTPAQLAAFEADQGARCKAMVELAGVKPQ
jgi:tripartite-type tricarboxylate transporter receptor subunit TctC